MFECNIYRQICIYLNKTLINDYYFCKSNFKSKIRRSSNNNDTSLGLGWEDHQQNNVAEIIALNHTY